jgi:DNA helicase-2/ATP-dependent DNA helicase PcrA
LEEIFLKAGLPYVLFGGIRFYERKEIKDILSYLRLLANPKDSVSAGRIEKIGKGKAAKFRELSETVRIEFDKYTTLELLDAVLEKTDYLASLDDGTEVGKGKVENVKELRSVAEQFPNLVDFLENVALVESEYSSDEKLKKSQREAITLTTLHQAKGLEWPVVFMAGMEEGLFPHSRCLLDPGEMEEERRLCYVGITRAKDKLYLTYTRQRLYFGTRSASLVSRFIMDLPKEIVESNSSDQNHKLDEDDWL